MKTYEQFIAEYAPVTPMANQTQPRTITATVNSVGNQLQISTQHGHAIVVLTPQQQQRFQLQFGNLLPRFQQQQALQRMQQSPQIQKTGT